jgi:hypothetical protein
MRLQVIEHPMALFATSIPTPSSENGVASAISRYRNPIRAA